MFSQKSKIFGVIIFIFAFSLAFVFAETPVGQGSALGKAADAMICKIDFTVAILSAYQTNINSSNLSFIIDSLGKDKTQLQTLSSTGNVSIIRDYVRNTFDSNLKMARESVEGVRGGAHKNLTKDQKQSLKDAYKKAQDTFSVCQKTGLKNLGDKRVEEFMKILDQHSIIADRLVAKGLDITGMKKVIDDAKAQIINPLKDALGKANSSDEIHAILKKYCLMDGCKNGINFHFATKFEMEKLSSTLNFVKSRNISVSEDQISKVASVVNSARSLLNELGNTQHADDGKNIKNSIQNAYGDLKNVRVRDNRTANKEIKAEMRDNRTEVRDNRTANKEMKAEMRDNRAEMRDNRTEVRDNRTANKEIKVEARTA